MHRVPPLAREAGFAAFASATVAAVLVWAGPPGIDFAAHAYQRTLFLQDGFQLWNNFWYAGRYSFVTYSLLYYPLAALLGIRLLAVATVATAALAFAVVLGREWGPVSRWSSRTFAVVWAGIVLSAAFPFALGVAFALLSLWALQSRARWRFAGLAAATLGASPLAFVLLTLVLLGAAIARRFALLPVVVVGVLAALEAALWRIFPSPGRYPFSAAEYAAAVAFCVVGAALTWRGERARPLRYVFLVYLVACTVAFALPSAVGENIARLRFVAVPMIVLALSLRSWRPRAVGIAALVLAASWNVSPLAANFVKGGGDPTSNSAYWRPVIGFLRAHWTPSYRVEAVDTAGHWEAVYLPRAGFPLARGWFRQEDFPQNALLYERLTPASYMRWLRSLGVRYVVLTSAPPDYSARREARLLESGRSGLVRVYARGGVSVFAVRHATPIVTGPGRAAVVQLTQTHLALRLRAPGRYRVAVRYSPFWRSSAGCVSRARDGMLALDAPAGVTTLAFALDADDTVAAARGSAPVSCAG